MQGDIRKWFGKRSTIATVSNDTSSNKTTDASETGSKKETSILKKPTHEKKSNSNNGQNKSLVGQKDSNKMMKESIVIKENKDLKKKKDVKENKSIENSNSKASKPKTDEKMKSNVKKETKSINSNGDNLKRNQRVKTPSSSKKKFVFDEEEDEEEEEGDDEEEEEYKVEEEEEEEDMDVEEEIELDNNEEEEEEEDDNHVRKRSKTSNARKSKLNKNEYDEDDDDIVIDLSNSKGRGRGRGKGEANEKGGKGKEVEKGKGRGRGGGGGFFFGERPPPPHRGEKEIPEGTPDALSGLTFVISGVLDSLEREEAEELIKNHGGRITSAVSGKTTYLLADEDVSGRKSQKAKELGTKLITEDGLFELIRSSMKNCSLAKSKPASDKISNQKFESKNIIMDKQKENEKENEKEKEIKKEFKKENINQITSINENQTVLFTNKYAPKSTDEIIGNPNLVKQLTDWLLNWEQNFLNSKNPKNEKKGSSSSSSFKKAVLLSGPPGIGKTTTAKLVCQLLGFPVLEVNASDSRGKSDSKVSNGLSSKTSNVVKEMINNESMELISLKNKNHNQNDSEWKLRKHPVLVMDEVDGMSSGDRGGVSELISCIKSTSIPIICICNDKYARKLMSLLSHVLQLNFRKPTKQQMAKRLSVVVEKENLQIPDVALEELAELSNGDMRMALNHLQFLSVSSKHLSFDDVKKRMKTNAKDEDVRPMAAVDKLFGVQTEKFNLNEKIDLAMSDIDLVPLFIQENYLNYKPVGLGNDSNSIKTLERISMAADYISYGDQVNVQVRRFQQWQHLPFSSLASSVIPAYLVRGSRQAFTGEMNYTRFPSWLGKNSSFSKFNRLSEELTYHLSASNIVFNSAKTAVRLDYAFPLVEHIMTPLKTMSKEKGVDEAIKILDQYSLTLEDFETLQSIIKFKSLNDNSFSIPSATKGFLTRKFKIFNHKYKCSDLLPGFFGQTKKNSAKKTKKPTQFEANVADIDLPLAHEEFGEEEEDNEEEASENESGDESSIPTKSKFASSSSTPLTIPSSSFTSTTTKGKKRKNESNESNKPKKAPSKAKGKQKI